jgi:polycomb protein EED
MGSTPYCCQISIKPEFLDRFSEDSSNIKPRENTSTESRKTDRQTDRQRDTERQTDRERERQTDRETDRQTDRETDRQTDTMKLIVDFRSFTFVPKNSSGMALKYLAFVQC